MGVLGHTLPWNPIPEYNNFQQRYSRKVRKVLGRRGINLSRWQETEKKGGVRWVDILLWEEAFIDFRTDSKTVLASFWRRWGISSSLAGQGFYQTFVSLMVRFTSWLKWFFWGGGNNGLSFINVRLCWKPLFPVSFYLNMRRADWSKRKWWEMQLPLSHAVP